MFEVHNVPYWLAYMFSLYFMVIRKRFRAIADQTIKHMKLQPRAMSISLYNNQQQTYIYIYVIGRKIFRSLTATSTDIIIILVYDTQHIGVLHHILVFDQLQNHTISISFE